MTDDEESFTREDVLQRLTAEEKAHYNKALHEMYELARLGTMKVCLSGNEDEWNTSLTSSNREHNNASTSSGKRHTRSSKTKRRSHKERGLVDEERKQVTSGHDDVVQEEVFQELCEISDRLQGESQRLKQWEEDLKQRELQLNHIEEQMKAKQESAKQAIVQEVDIRISEMETRLRKTNELTDENKRLRSSIKVFKESSEKLKGQLSETETSNHRYEAKNSALQRRLLNLQRKIELLTKELDQQKSQENKSNNVQRVTSQMQEKTNQQKPPVKSRKMYEMLAVLLGWVSNAYLKQHAPDVNGSNHPSQSDACEHDVTHQITKECFYQVLPVVASIFGDIVHLSANVQLPFLQFTYWSLTSFEESQTEPQCTHPVSFRHISQVIFNPKESRRIEKSNEPTRDTKTMSLPQSFLYSTNQHLRLLSCLFLLKSLTQVDLLAQVFEVLKYELREDEVRGLFLRYEGSRVLLFHLKPSSKGLLAHVISVLMQLVTESAYLSMFLQSISSTAWLQALVFALTDATVDVKQAEKLSIVLQRLSKLRSNKAVFEMLQVYGIVEELSRRTSPENTFLILNLKSILHNLDSHEARTGN